MAKTGRPRCQTRPAFPGDPHVSLTERGRHPPGRRETGDDQGAIGQSEPAGRLLSRWGEAPGVALAHDPLIAFEHADARLAFLKARVEGFGPDAKAAKAALAAVRRNPDPGEAIEARALAARRHLFPARPRQGGTDRRSGGALSPRQWRAARSSGRCLRQWAEAIAWADGQPSPRSRPERGEPRRPRRTQPCRGIGRCQGRAARRRQILNPVSSEWP